MLQITRILRAYLHKFSTERSKNERILRKTELSPLAEGRAGR